MALDEVRLLLVRPLDHLIAMVGLSGFELNGNTLTAGPGGARIQLTMPPQGIGETIYDTVAGLAQARLGGPSRLSYRIAPTASAPFTVEGILTLAAGGIVTTDDIELPWRLHLRPTANYGTLQAIPPTHPILGATLAAGLWHLRLEAKGGLLLNPFDTEDDGDIKPPLDRGRRDRIIAESQDGPQPTAPHIDLSALGGTLSANGTWDSFSWHHETVLGRDMVVRTESKGYLYPWGHRAVLIEAARRTMVPPDGAQATAGLEELRLLVIPDPVRRRPAPGKAARGLPFDTVEVIQTTVELGGEFVPDEGRYQRPAKRLDQLRADVTARRQALDTQEQTVRDLFHERHQVIDGSAQYTIDQLTAQLEEPGRRLAGLEADQAAWDDWRASIPPVAPFPDYEFPPPPDVPQPNPDEMNNLRAVIDDLVRQQGEAEQWRQAAHYELAPEGNPNEDALAAAGSGYAEAVATVRQLRTEVPALETRLREAEHEADQKHDVFLWPLAKSGARLTLPVRCDALQVDSPVLFVHDLDFADNADFPAFRPLGDAGWISKIATAWRDNEGRKLAVPAIPVDLVRSESPQLCDILPVHQLTVSGISHTDGFRAVIDEAKVALQAVSSLVPGHDGLTRVAFDKKYLDTGVADKVALRLLDGLTVDFSREADKAGGLISPVFEANVLSRSHGPVDERAIPGHLAEPPDLATLFSDTTLLGIPLADLLAAAPASPLSIVPTADGGASMTWDDLVLTSRGPLKTTAATAFELTVISSPATTLTRCKLDNFTLVLPPETDIVQLHFGTLMYEQRPGHPPVLHIEGLRCELGGDLGLLKTLQDKLDLGTRAPTVRPTSNGIAAGYSLAVPEVAAGMFIMRNFVASVGVEVPFDGDPVVTTLAFAGRENPFNLSVSLFGGGGYLIFEIAESGVRRVEASLEFGAAVAVGIGVAKAGVYALGGVRFLLQGSRIAVSGFLRIGGSVEVLGLVSVSVELRVELTYDGRSLRGRAAAVVEIDVTFWSGSITIDSGEYVFAGAEDGGHQPMAAIQEHEPSIEDWRHYREKFGAA